MIQEGFYTVDMFDCEPFRMFTADDCPRARDILEEKRFEPASMALWCKLARKATGILDIGAQVGVYSLAAAKLRPDLTIHAFEPNPDAFARLKLHLRINGLTNVHAHRYALSDRDVIAAFSWIEKGHISSGGHIGSHEGFSQFTTVPVQTVRLDQMRISLGERGLVKIDVEGGEANVLRGMPETLRQKPDIIIESFSPENCAVINCLAKEFGYWTYKIHERENRLEPRDSVEPCDPRGEDYNHFLTTRPELIVPAIRPDLIEATSMMNPDSHYE